MRTKLKNIASIQTGLFARTVSEGEIVFLKAKHFNENGLIVNYIRPELIRSSSVELHLLKPGDVLFAAKGTRNFAAVYDIPDQSCVASTSFFVIRLKENSILPEYLVWYLNHPGTLQLLKAQAIGTSIVSISKPVLEELEISIPDMKTQQTILIITKLRIKEKQLKQQVEKLRETQIQHLIIKAIK
ncbi:MAG: hypothetical protein D4R64_12555 [Porphyromonadaceae bacterium]|nr:MAG: hypothetical protein D4R64_12555 [Porphyromonadaceae bacterium]